MIGFSDPAKYRVVQAMNGIVDAWGDFNTALVDAEDTRDDILNIDPELEQKLRNVIVDVDVVAERIRELGFRMDQLRHKGML